MAIIQVRNISEDAHRRFKELAGREGISLSEYLRRELERMATLPTWDEIGQRLSQYPPVDLAPGETAKIIREEREAHDRRRRLSGY